MHQYSQVARDSVSGSLECRYVCRDISKDSTSIVRGQGVQKHTYERSRGQFLFYVPHGVVTVNLRAQYRRRMSSTPETGRLACTSVVFRLRAARGVYRWGTSAISRFKAARGRIPLIYRAVSTLYVIDARGRTSSVHECSISFSGRTRHIPFCARLQYRVRRPHGAVYR